MTADKIRKVEASPTQRAGVTKALELRTSVLDKMGYTDNRPPLLAELVAAGLAPMDPLSVKRYQDSKTKETFPWWIVGWFIPATAALSTIAAAIWTHIMAWDGPLASSDFFTMLECPTGILALISLCMAVVCYASRNTPWFTHIRTSREWRTCSLAHYHGTAPTRVWETARLVQESCPDAQLKVSELHEIPNQGDRDRADKRALWVARGGFMDPFLIVERDKETYFLEVWDEPGFLGV